MRRSGWYGRGGGGDEGTKGRKGDVFFLFRKKERTKEKSIAFGLFARLEYYARYRGTAFFIREAAYLY